MFLVADYVRERSDLVLVGPDGQTVVIDNYFAMANPPALATAAGAGVPGDLVRLVNIRSIRRRRPGRTD